MAISSGKMAMICQRTDGFNAENTPLNHRTDQDGWRERVFLTLGFIRTNRRRRIWHDRGTIAQSLCLHRSSRVLFSQGPFRIKASHKPHASGGSISQWQDAPISGSRRDDSPNHSAGAAAPLKGHCEAEPSDPLSLVQAEKRIREHTLGPVRR
jgi:hypothetical protein